MGNCRICQDSVPEYQTFCSRCGARQAVGIARGSARRNNVSRIKNFFSEARRSEVEKRFDAACELARYSYDAAIQGIEHIPDLDLKNPRFRGIIAVFYASAGDERMGLGGLGGP